MSDILTKQTKIIVWQNDNFKITTPSIPHICKQDGGHLIVSPQQNVSSITQLHDDLLLEMYKKLSSVSWLLYRFWIKKV